jgi:hypothetical protein
MIKNKFENSNYITIQGWMINELKLKGNELLLYAIVFGFTQQTNEWYHGSLNYIMSALGCNSKNTVVNTLQSLINKNYVLKENYVKNNVKYCRYKANPEVYQFLVWGIPNFGTNNNIYIKENNNISNDILLKEKTKKSSKNKPFIPPTLEEVEEYCKNRNNNVDAKKFWDYYNDSNWTDQQGKQVKNWKQKMIGNWEEDKKEEKDEPINPEWMNKEIKKQEANEEERKELEKMIRGIK